MEQTQSKYDVFISYSHEDQKLVLPIAQILKVDRKELVFFDKYSLQPGMRWEDELTKALREADTFFIFWCEHSAISAYVRKEYQFALKNNKKIVPVILDNTKLVKSLSQYQWIDFKDASSHSAEKLPTKFENNGDDKKDWLYRLKSLVTNPFYKFSDLDTVNEITKNLSKEEKEICMYMTHRLLYELDKYYYNGLKYIK